MVPNIVVDLSGTPRLAVDEVEKVQRQRIEGLIRGPAREGSHVARLNFKTSRVGVY